MAFQVHQPHIVFFVDDLESVDIESVAPGIQKNSLFPHEVNVGVAEIKSANHMLLKVFERGAGLTTACGSGACAVAVVSMLLNRVERSVVIELRGGELELRWESEADSVFMTGPAAEVFTGSYPLDPPSAEPVTATEGE